MQIIVNNILCGTIEPGNPWTIGPDDLDEQGNLMIRHKWIATPLNKTKVSLDLFTRGAAEFYVAACAGQFIGR